MKEQQHLSHFSHEIRRTFAVRESEKNIPKTLDAHIVRLAQPLVNFVIPKAELLPTTKEMLATAGIDTAYVDPTPIGAGLTNVVFSYTHPDMPPMVVKIPKIAAGALMSTGYEQDVENGLLVKRFFGQYAVPTEVRKTSSDTGYIFLQEKVSGTPITNENNPESIRSQLADLARLNREMMRQTGHSLDFIGMPGFVTWLRHHFKKIVLSKSTFELSNILVDTSGKIRIIDNGLLRFDKNAPLAQRLSSHAGLFINQLIMKHYFGVDLNPKHHS